MLLLVHGEVTDPEVDFFDREAVFIDRHLAPLLDNVCVVSELSNRSGSTLCCRCWLCSSWFWCSAGAVTSMCH